MIKKFLLIVSVACLCLMGLISFFISIKNDHHIRTLASKSSHGSWVDDRANLLTEASRIRLNNFLSLFHSEKDIEFYAVIIPSLGNRNIDQVANQLFENLRIGGNSKGRGILFLLSAQEQIVRFEIGYALEPLFTDLFVSQLEQRQMAPFFKSGRIADGFEATLELIVDHAREEIEKLGYIPGKGDPVQSGSQLSGGGGAKVAIETVETPKSSEEGLEQYSAQATPEKTFALYLERAKLHITNPNLGIFTPETRDFLSKWTVTLAQLDNEYRAFFGQPFKTFIEGDYAVIRFPIENRLLSPFFLHKSAEGWQLDFAIATKAIFFNHRNEWFLASSRHPYMFAFADVSFDSNGFPHAESGNG